MRIFISLLASLYLVVGSAVGNEITVSLAVSAPVASPGPVNVTGVLDRGGQFTTFISLLKNTQVGNQLQIQINSSNSGITVFAPTDSAFQGLKPGALNSITDQQKVGLLLYHVLPTYYSLSQFQTLSNPLRTLASGNGGLPFALNVTSVGLNQVNMSTGLVNTQLSNSLYSQNPLAVYKVDKVLLPEDIFGVKEASAPAPVVAASGPAPLSATSPSHGKSDNTAQTATSGSSLTGGCFEDLFLIVFSSFLALFWL